MGSSDIQHETVSFEIENAYYSIWYIRQKYISTPETGAYTCPEGDRGNKPTTFLS